MVAVKRKAADQAASALNAPTKKRQPQADFVDPYIDASSDDEDSDAGDSDAGQEDGAADFVEEGSGSDEEDEDQEDQEEQDDGAMDIDDDDEEDATPVRRKAAAPSHALYKAPTNDEIQNLKETTDLFKSNLFKLQIDELLGEVKLDQTNSRTTALEKALRTIKGTLDSVDDIPERTLAEVVAAMKKQKIVVPFADPAPPADTQYKFAFKRPSKVFVVGSYLLKTGTKSPNGTNVDIAVQMPDAVLQDKDTVNYRYFHKRAYYLAVLAAELRNRERELGIKVEFEAFQGDRRRPVLVIRSVGDGSQYDFAKLGCVIRILVTIPQTAFPPARLAPARNNVRPSYLNPESAASETTADHTPTPRYNAALLQETAFVAHMNLLHHHTTSCIGFRDACVLGKVWLNQRGFSAATGGFSGFLFSMVMGYLLRTNDKNGNRRLGNSFSSYQLLKVTMEYLANHDFRAEPLFMTPDGKPVAEKGFEAEAFLAAYEVVMVDPSGKINLASGLTGSALDELQFEARRSTALLNDVGNDHFDALFLQRVDLSHLRFDNAARVAAVAQPPAAYTTAVELDFQNVHDFLLSHIPKLLKSALTKRATLVSARSAALPSWSCSKDPASHEDLATPITLGFMLDAEHSTAIVEHGPAADDEVAAEAFRAIWGKKSELRRFQNGSILESVVFDSDGTLEQRSLIVSRMVAYLVETHIGVYLKHGLTIWAGQLNKFVRAAGIEMQATSYQTVMDAFNLFARNLRHLNGLPLSVSQSVPCAEGLRYASVFIPQPRLAEAEAASDAYRPYYEPLDVVIEFESSGRWPGDLAAIQLAKRAFYIKIAELFMDQHKGTHATVSRGLGTHVLDSGHVEVTTATGYTFKCTIHVDREAVLLEQALKESGDDAASKQALSLAKTHYEQTYVRLPMHSGRIQNLGTRFPFLPQTIRLVKRWFAAHLLSPHVAPELVELLCAKVFVSPSPWGVPSSGFAGFLRTLDLLKNWNFKREPLIVELEAGLMTAGVRNQINEAFRVSRGFSKDGSIADGPRKPVNPAMWVATEQDINGRWWSEGSPNVLIADRVRSLATAALAHVEALIRDGGSDKSLSKLFVSVPKGYSALLRLDTTKLPRFRESLSYDPEILDREKPKYRNLVAVKDRELALLSEIDPAECLLADLRAAFGGCALFFHDRYGGDTIGVVWNPTVAAPGPWKADARFNGEAVLDGGAAGRRKASSEKPGKPSVTPNFTAMVAEMQRLGEGLVVAVDLA
ncbi:hypothetical protein HKX48_008533 [Thoreauomyces humboldtii]|nr:hypothetical protein HKX48_008533 [Thoreauomyces humboldtii]